MVAIIVIVALVVAGGALGGVLLLTGNDSASSGDTIEGRGYSYAIPEGWSDARDRVDPSQGIDTVVRADDADGGFHTNVLVEVDSASGVTDPATIKEQWTNNIGNAVGGTPEPIDGTTIDGQDAIGVRIQTAQRDIQIVQVAYLVLNDGKVYSIALSANADAADAATDTFQELLDSWSWKG